MTHKNRPKVQIICSQSHRPYVVQSWHKVSSFVYPDKVFWVSSDTSKVAQTTLLYTDNEVKPRIEYNDAGMVEDGGADMLPERQNMDIVCNACERVSGRSRALAVRYHILEAVLTTLFDLGWVQNEFAQFETVYRGFAEKYPRRADGA